MKLDRANEYAYAFFKSAFYKEMIKHGTVLYDNPLPKEIIEKRFKNYLKAWLKKECIESYMNDEKVFKDFYKVTFRRLTVYEYNGNRMLQFMQNGVYRVILYLDKAIEVLYQPNLISAKKIYLEQGLFLFCSNNDVSHIPDYMYNGYIDNWYCRRIDYNHTGIKSLFLHNARYLDKKIKKILNKEDLDPQKVKRNKNAYANDNYQDTIKAEGAIIRFIYLNFYKYFLNSFTSQERSLLYYLNRLNVDSFFIRVMLIFRFRKTPFLTERLYLSKYLIMFLTTAKDMSKFAEMGDMEFINSHIQEIKNSEEYYGSTHKYFDITIKPRHIDFLKGLKSNEIKMFFNELFVNLFYLSKLEKEKIPQNYIELCLFLREPEFYSIAKVADIRTVSKNLKNDFGKVKQKDICRNVNEFLRNVFDYIDYLVNKARCINKINTEVIYKDLFKSELKDYFFSTMIKDSHHFHENFNRIDTKFNAFFYKDMKETFSADTHLLIDTNEINGIKVTSLTNRVALSNESLYMDHCVSGYDSSVSNGYSFIFHFGDYADTTGSQSHIDNQSTIEFRFDELRGGFYISQHHNFKNQKKGPLSNEHRNAGIKLLNQINAYYNTPEKIQQFFLPFKVKRAKVDLTITFEEYKEALQPMIHTKTFKKILAYIERNLL